VKLGARIAFAASLAANVAALYLLFEEPPSVHAPMALAAPAAQRVGVVQTGADVVAYRETLLARGLALEETKPLVLARLMAELLALGLRRRSRGEHSATNVGSGSRPRAFARALRLAGAPRPGVRAAV
jgi:hypothetical protein